MDCIICGRRGARCQSRHGYAHKRCDPSAKPARDCSQNVDLNNLCKDCGGTGCIQEGPLAGYIDCPSCGGTGCFKELILRGTLFRCECGETWEAAVGGIWLCIPRCSRCRKPATAWKGIWEELR
jgi:hypothetical protein